MAYEYEKNVVAEIKELGARYKAPSFYAMADEVEDVYAKAKAFDNYMVDLVKSIETYPYDYKRTSNFAKETYDFYKQSKEDFIEAYKKDVSQGQELIESVEEYDRIIKKLEGDK